jgi:hypothetical protein
MRFLVVLLTYLGSIHWAPVVRVGLATNFAAVGDPWNPNPWAACLHRNLRDASDVVVAHPTLPCRSRVLVVNLRTMRAVVALVGDRGPRRALVDLAPATARRLRANGWERVVFVALGGP